jgi:hypothetical protein
MERRSFKRAFLFGILGALIFLVINGIVIAIITSARNFFLFKVYEIPVDLFLLKIIFKFNLFIVIGFIAGWAYYLFGDFHWQRKSRSTQSAPKKTETKKD